MDETLEAGVFTLERDIILGGVEQTEWSKHAEEKTPIDTKAKLREYAALGAAELLRAIDVQLPAEYEHVDGYFSTKDKLVELIVMHREEEEQEEEEKKEEEEGEKEEEEEEGTEEEA